MALLRLRFNELLGSALLEESKVDPERETAETDNSPRDPDVSRCVSIEDEVSCAISVLVGKKYFREDDSDREPSVAAFNRVVLAFNSVPSSDVFISLPEPDISECEPKEKTGNGEEMLWRDEDSVHDEEIH